MRVLLSEALARSLPATFASLFHLRLLQLGLRGSEYRARNDLVYTLKR